MNIHAYNAQIAASLPDGHPLKEQLASVQPPMSSSAPVADYPSPLLTPPPVAPAPNMSVAPPVPPPPVGPQVSLPPPVRSEAGPMSVEPPPAPSPVQAHPPAPMGPTIIRGAASPAREIPIRGPTQAALDDRAYGTLVDTAERTSEAQKSQFFREAMASRVREDDAVKQEVEAANARQRFQEQADAIKKDADRVTQEIARGPEATQLDGGNKVLAGLAIALGAFGATYSGTGRNYAMEIVNDTIKHDVAQKRAAYEAKRDRLGAKQDAFGRLVQQYGMSGAEKLWSAAHADKLAAQAEQLAAQRGIGQADVAYQQTVGTLNARRDKEKAASIGFIQAHQGQNMVFDPQIGVPVSVEKYGAHKMGMIADEAKEGAKAGAKADDERAKLFVATGPDGQGFLAATEKEGIAARGVVTAKETIVPVVEEMRGLRKKISKTDIAIYRATGRETPDIARFKGLAADGLVQMRELSATSPGAMDKGMQELGTGILGGDSLRLLADPYAFDAAASGFVGRVNKRVESLSAGGAQSAQQRIERNKRGDVVTRPQGRFETGSPTPAMPATTPFK